MVSVPGRFLVQGDRVNNKRLGEPCRLLCCTEPLSFWGGIDPITSKVIDRNHPLHGQLVADTVLVIPSGL